MPLVGMESMIRRVFVIIALTSGCDANLSVTTTQGNFAVSSDNGDVGLRILSDEAISNKSAVSVAWEITGQSSAFEGATYTLRVARDMGCHETVFVFENLSTTNQTVNFAEDGVYHLCVAAKSSRDDIISADNNGLMLTIDRTAPVITTQQTNFIADDPISIAPKVSDATALTYHWEKVSGIGEATFSDSTAQNDSATFFL